MRKILRYTMIVVAGVLIVSCSSKKKVADNTAGNQSENTYVTPDVKPVTKPENICADMSFTLKRGNDEISVPGTLKMRREKCVRLQLQMPLLGSEVGRLEFTPDYVLIVDRMNKQYMKESYLAITLLTGGQVDFQTIQSLLWNDSGDATFEKSLAGLASLMWNYSNRSTVGGWSFPRTQVVSMDAMGKNVTVTMKFSDLSTKGGWESETSVSDKYKKVDAATILKMLVK